MRKEFSDLTEIKPGIEINLAIWDECDGPARVINNDTENKNLIISWLELPTACYDSNGQVVPYSVMKSDQVIPYDMIACASTVIGA